MCVRWRTPSAASWWSACARLTPLSTVAPRSCSPVLAGSKRRRSPTSLGCDPQTVRNAIAAFNTRGLAALRKGSSRPHRFRVAFDLRRGEQLRALLHQSPRTFGKPTSVWTLELAADVSCEQGLTTERVSGETIRATLQRLGIRWKRAKRWITSPDPEYARKKARAIA